MQKFFFRLALALIFAVPKTKGSLAQLVQSICLTSRGSAVRTRQLPQKSPLLRGFLINSVLLQATCRVVRRSQTTHRSRRSNTCKVEISSIFFQLRLWFRHLMLPKLFVIPYSLHIDQ